jgi:hypothetical protein
MTTRWARFARGWMVAGFSTFVAALSHTLGGGHAPGWLGLVLSLAFAGVVCVGLAGRTVSGVRVGVSVLLSQLIFHGLFSLGAAGGALVPTPAAGAHGHQTANVLVVTGNSAALAEGHGTSVWVFHAAAAVVTVLGLRHGEAAFHRILNLARLIIRSLIALVVGVIPPLVGRQSPVGLVVLRPVVVLLSSLRRRGPPSLVARVA